MATQRKSTSQFIEQAQVVHGNKYDYSKVQYKTSRDKVCIICPKHGVFLQAPRHHLEGGGCSKCAHNFMSTEDFVQKAKLVHGDRFDYSKTKFIDSRTKVCITCRVHGDFFQRPDSHLDGRCGCPACRTLNYKKTCDIGSNNVPFSSKTHCHGVWDKMLRRCYSEKEQSHCPTYKDCTVCDEWKEYANFEKWFNQHYVEGWQIDKDILVKNNRVYSPSTCCFVPHAINTSFIKHKSTRGKYPLGVIKSGNSYVAYISKYDRHVHLGCYSTIEGAFNAYKQAKEAFLKELADKYKDKLESRVYEAIYNYKVEITD